MQVNSIEELKQVLSQKIAKVIMEDHELKEAVNQGSKQIYDEFEPMTYQRRYENGGFGDPDNIDMEVEVTGNSVEVTLTNDTLAVGYNDGEYLDYYIDKGIYQTKNKPPERHFMEYSKNNSSAVACVVLNFFLAITSTSTFLRYSSSIVLI